MAGFNLLPPGANKNINIKKCKGGCLQPGCGLQAQNQGHEQIIITPGDYPFKYVCGKLHCHQYQLGQPLCKNKKKQIESAYAGCLLHVMAFFLKTKEGGKIHKHTWHLFITLYNKLNNFQIHTGHPWSIS